jgi:hypothetical protein
VYPEWGACKEPAERLDSVVNREVGRRDNPNINGLSPELKEHCLENELGAGLNFPEYH